MRITRPHCTPEDRHPDLLAGDYCEPDHDLDVDAFEEEDDE